MAVVAAACGHAGDTGRPERRPAAAHHIDAPDDVRWPVERRTFHGTIRHLAQPDRAASRVMLELADGTRVGLHGPDLDASGPVHVSGRGRRLDPEEARLGALLSLRDVRLEPAPGPDEPLRSRADLEVAVRQTRVTADGVLVERPSPRGPAFLLRLSPDAHARVLVTVDGVAEAQAHAGTRVRLQAYLMPMPDEYRPRTGDVLPGLALAQPEFLPR